MWKIEDPIDDLTRIAIRHGTDKWGGHFYTPVYHSLFQERRHDTLKILEIGVGGYEHPNLGGNSLSMWAEYFPNSEIIGVDIHEKRLSLDDRISILRGSQTDEVFLTSLVSNHGPFDIVIDDGSHIPQHVVQTFHILWPTLVDGGQYIIEDIQTSLWKNWGGSLLDGGPTFQLARNLIDSLNFAEAAVANSQLKIDAQIKTIRSVRAFHNVIAIEKGDNDEPSNLSYDLKNKFSARVVQTITEQMSHSPTADGYANLISIYTSGGDIAEALKVSELTIKQWPNSPSVLFAAANAYELSGNKAKAELLREKLKDAF